MKNKHFATLYKGSKTPLGNRIAASRSTENELKLATRLKQNSRRILLCIPILASMIGIGIILKDSSAITLNNSPSDFNALLSHLAIGEDTINLIGLQNANGETYNFLDVSADLPEFYNLTSYINLPLKDQGSLSNCAFFTANRVTESSILMDAARDGANYETLFTTSSTTELSLSERYLDYLTSTNVRGDRTFGTTDDSTDSSPTTLGNAFSALELYGAPLESDYTYEGNYTREDFDAASIVARVRSTISFPNLSTTAGLEPSVRDNWLTVIKYMISHVSAIATDIISPVSQAQVNANPAYAGLSPNYDDTTNAYYYTTSMDNSNIFSGHGVTLVGWDDNFSKDYFPTYTDSEGNETAPTRDGAFIALNSWGEEWGNGGYFYISYDSENFLRAPYAVIEAQDLRSAATYEQSSGSNIYELDKNGSGTTYADINNNTDQANNAAAFTTESITTPTKLTHKYFAVQYEATDASTKYPEGSNAPFLYQIGLGVGSLARNYFVNVYLNTTDSSLNKDSLKLVATVPLGLNQTTFHFPEPVLLDHEFALVFEFDGELEYSRIASAILSESASSLYNTITSDICADSLNDLATASTTCGTSIPILAYFQTGTYLGEDPDADHGSDSNPDSGSDSDSGGSSDSGSDSSPSSDNASTDKTENSTPNATEVASADTTADTKQQSSTPSAPNTGANDAEQFADRSERNDIFLPVTVIVIFGSMLAYDLIRKH